MTIVEFVALHPQFAFDFAAPLKNQTRILESPVLLRLPDELTTDTPYQPGGRGRPNPNQTRTHSQCGSCLRVLRNDHFYTPDSLRARNLIYSYCRDCAQQFNNERVTSTFVRERKRTQRDRIVEYLAPRCVLCGFDRHPCALELHAVGGDETKLAELLDGLVASPNTAIAERLLLHAKMAVALCSNCHRMVDAGVLSIPRRIDVPTYNLAHLMRLLVE